MDQESPAVVIDVGSELIKCGFAGDTAPRRIFRTAVGRPRTTLPGLPVPLKEFYVGEEAIQRRGVLAIKYPVEFGLITNFDDFEKLLVHSFLNELVTAPEDQPLLITHWCHPRMNRERLAQIAVRNGALRATELLCAAQFESLHVPALYVSAQEALSLYATGRTTGIVMQLGSGSVNCVPLYEGCVVNQHIPHRVPFTGRDCVASMMRLLTDKGYDFGSTREYDLALDVVKQVAHCAQDYNAEVSQAESVEYVMPDGKTIVVGAESMTCIEGFFQPSLFQHESYGIDGMLHSCIMRCQSSGTSDFSRNVILAGGYAVRGVATRLQREIDLLKPLSLPCRIVAPDNPLTLPFVGGAILSGLSSFQQMHITPAEYDEHGPRIVERKC